MTCPFPRCNLPLKEGSAWCYHHSNKLDKAQKSDKGITKQSDKEKERVKQYKQAADDYKKKYPLCQANLPGCIKLTTEVHHQKGRIGALLKDTRYFLACCPNCHREIETHPTAAKALGLSVSRHTKTETT